MSPTENQTYKKDCMSYRQLTKLEDHDVLQIRMEMDGDLKRIIDTNYPKYEENTVEEALEIVETIVTAVSNVAVYRHRIRTGLYDSMLQQEVLQKHAEPGASGKSVGKPGGQTQLVKWIPY